MKRLSLLIVILVVGFVLGVVPAMAQTPTYTPTPVGRLPVIPASESDAFAAFGADFAVLDPAESIPGCDNGPVGPNEVYENGAFSLVAPQNATCINFAVEWRFNEIDQHAVDLTGYGYISFASVFVDGSYDYTQLLVEILDIYPWPTGKPLPPEMPSNGVPPMWSGWFDQKLIESAAQTIHIDDPAGGDQRKAAGAITLPISSFRSWHWEHTQPAWAAQPLINIASDLASIESFRMMWTGVMEADQRFVIPYVVFHKQPQAPTIDQILVAFTPPTPTPTPTATPTVAVTVAAPTLPPPPTTAANG